MTEPFCHIATVNPESVYEEVIRAAQVCRAHDIRQQAMRMTQARLDQLNEEVIAAIPNSFNKECKIEPGDLFLGMVVGLWDGPGLAVGTMESLGSFDGMILNFDPIPVT